MRKPRRQHERLKKVETKHHKHMTSEQIVAAAQALATVTEDQFETTLATFVTNLQAFIAATPAPAADPIVTLVGTTQSGATVTFVPQTA
jgi:hypothetical protein